jgi:toxin ParE2
MSKLRVLSPAEFDLAEAIDWYLERSVSAADRFLAEVNAAFSAIEQEPERFPQWDSSHRYRLLNRFPYYIAYRVEAEDVLIVAVRHTARESTDWPDR